MPPEKLPVLLHRAKLLHDLHLFPRTPGVTLVEIRQGFVQLRFTQFKRHGARHFPCIQIGLRKREEHHVEMRERHYADSSAGLSSVGFVDVAVESIEFVQSAKESIMAFLTLEKKSA